MKTEEQESKLNWVFDTLRFQLENISDESHKNKLLDQADKIELDYEVEETSLENKTENAVRGK